MNWRCWIGSRWPLLEVLFWPMIGHLLRFRLREVYCERPGCQWTDVY